MAFVYFAVGQATVLRGGAQTAADAAALAAAQDLRHQLREGWLGVVDDPAQWQRFVDGDAVVDAPLACRSADDFAAANGADVDQCLRTGLGFKVTVRTRDTVGESIVPGTEPRQATATASAVIEPRCSFDEPEPTLEPDPPQESTPPPTPSAEPEEPELISGLVCDGDELDIDPEDPALPEATELFHVRLTSDDE